ncbi:hypothetical protein quinque_010221 [Culex quinquefasciatus]
MRLLFVVALLVASAFAAVPRTNPSKANLQTSRRLLEQLVTRGMPQTPRKPASEAPSKRIVVENFFTTRIDHFDPQNTAEWTLRYLAVTDYYQPGGPILIWLGGNAPIQPYMVDESSLIYDMAREMHGAVIAFESRFYGQSWVTSDTSTENLRFLNTDQILADLAEFVTYLRREVTRNENAHVLVSGVGYGGSLATWFRVRYPHLADAAWSSGGLHNALMDFQEFAEAWGQTLIDHGSQECYNEIFVAFHVMQNLIDAGREEILHERLNLCTEIDTEDRLQVQFFFITMMTSIELYTLGTLNLDSFSEVCNDLTGVDAPTALDSFADWFNNKFHAQDDCAVIDPDTFIDWLRDDDWYSPFVQMGARQIFYQECTEFGWFLTTDSDQQPFGNRVTVDAYSELCTRVFGDWISFESIYRGTQRANNRFGALSPNVNNIHFTNGGEDPFRMLSIRNDLNAQALHDLIPNELIGSDVVGHLRIWTRKSWWPSSEG